MKRSIILLLVGVGAACSGRPQAVALFDSRVAYEPLATKLKASGGDPARIVRPRRAADLSALQPGKRYKFVVGPEGTLAIAPLPADAPSNEYVHPVLGGGGPVRTAGNIRIDREGESLVRVVVDQDSKSYCPAAESLSVALEALSNLGIPGDRLRVDNRPPACVGAEPAPAEGPRYGALMAEVGTRFERMGRAARAGRFELAEFERGEIEEIFEEDLPKAEPPRESAGVNLAGVAQAFAQTNLPDLKKAIESTDPSAIKRAYALAAETCNGCHRTSGHAFVEIPGQPGQPVPRLDPLQQR
jgi:mono/diheme cytochrome c family protein